MTLANKRIVCVVASGLSLVIGQGLVFDDVEFRVLIGDSLQDEEETSFQPRGEIVRKLGAQDLIVKNKKRIVSPELTTQAAFLLSAQGADLKRNLPNGFFPHSKQNQDILSALGAGGQFEPACFNISRHRAGALFVWPHPDRAPPCFLV